MTALWFETSPHTNKYKEINMRYHELPYKYQLLYSAIASIYHDRYNNGFGNQKKEEASLIGHFHTKIKKFMKDPEHYGEFMKKYRSMKYGETIIREFTARYGRVNWYSYYDEALEDLAEGVVQLCYSKLPEKFFVRGDQYGI